MFNLGKVGPVHGQTFGHSIATETAQIGARISRIVFSVSNPQVWPNLFAEDDVDDSGHLRMGIVMTHIDKSSVKRIERYFTTT